MFAWWRNTLDIVEHQQIGVEGVSGSGDVFQVERWPDKAEPLGDVFQCVQRLVEPIGVRAVKFAVTDRRGVDAGKPRSLPAEQPRSYIADRLNSIFGKAKSRYP